MATFKLDLKSRNRASPNTWSSGMVRQVRGWRIFLRNHAPDIAAVDLFAGPTIAFNLLCVFVIVRLGRRDLGQRHNKPDGCTVRTPVDRRIHLE